MNRLAYAWHFGKLVAEERWSIARGDRNQRFDGSFLELALCAISQLISGILGRLFKKVHTD